MASDGKLRRTISIPASEAWLLQTWGSPAKPPACPAVTPSQPGPCTGACSKTTRYGAAWGLQSTAPFSAIAPHPKPLIPWGTCNQQTGPGQHPAPSPNKEH